MIIDIHDLPGSPPDRFALLPEWKGARVPGTGHMLKLKERFVLGGADQVGNVYQSQKGLTVIATLDKTPFGTLLHVPASYPTKLPSWAEMRGLKELFFGRDIDAMMMLPREQEYIDVHEYCLHLTQCPQKWGLM